MAKLPLILLPGLLCDAAVWSYQQTHLSDLVDIIIPDLNHAATPDEMVASVLNVAPPYFALAGHSMGGWVALEVMKKSSARVLGLGLLNTTALPDSNEKYQFRQDMILQARSGNYAPIIEKLMKLFIYNETVSHEVRMMLQRNLTAFINQENAMSVRAECLSVLDRITCPTLIVHATHDAIFTLQDSQLLATRIKRATFAVIENCGHMSPMESPEDVNKLLRVWLNIVSSVIAP